MNSRLSHRAALDPVHALLRAQHRDLLAIPGHDELAFDRIVVRTLHVPCAGEPELVPLQLRRFAGSQTQVTLDPVRLDARHAEHEQTDTDVGETHAEYAGRQRLPLQEPRHGFEQRRSDHPEAGREADHRHHVLTTVQHQGDDEPECERRHEQRRQWPLHRFEARALPASVHAYGEQEHERDGRHQERDIEVRWTHRDLAEVQRIEEQRIQRAEQDQSSRDDQQRVVGEQHRLAGNRSETRLLGSKERRAGGVQRERTTDHDHQEREDEETPARVARERVHGNEHPRTHQERAEQ